MYSMKFLDGKNNSKNGNKKSNNKEIVLNEWRDGFAQSVASVQIIKLIIWIGGWNDAASF